VIPRGPYLDKNGLDALGREWRFVDGELIPWSGIFERQLDGKGRHQVFKLLDGVEVLLSDDELERHETNRAQREARRIRVTYWKGPHQNDRTGLQPRALNGHTQRGEE
jgi:hypothetical protein